MWIGDPALEAPTFIERKMHAALDRLQIRYEMQVWFGTKRVDAYLPDLHVALEADGCFHHGCECGDYVYTILPHADAERKRQSNHVRDLYLLRNFDLPVLHIW